MIGKQLSSTNKNSSRKEVLSTHLDVLTPIDLPIGRIDLPVAPFDLPVGGG